MASPTKITADYATSNRSTCKKCSSSISADSLRLGLHSKDPRGYDLTEWHHLNCFTNDSFQPIHGSVLKIQGFSSLKSSDQEALKRLTADGNLELKQASDHGEKEVLEGNEDGLNKSKPFIKIVADYAKPSSSSCHKCTKKIPANSLRLGSITKDQGHDVTTWYHPVCFLADSQPIIDLDKLDGYSSLEDCCQQALKMIMEEIQSDILFTMPTTTNPCWKGGSALAMLLKKERAIILACDFRLVREELNPSYERCYHLNDKVFFRETREKGFLHELDSTTACAVVGDVCIADSWIQYLESKLGHSIKKDSLTNRRKLKDNNYNPKLLTTSLTHLLEYQERELSGKPRKDMAEVLLVGWNESKEPTLYHVSNAGQEKIEEGFFWAGLGKNIIMKNIEYKADISIKDATTRAQELILLANTKETPGNMVAVWTLQLGLPIQRTVVPIENLRNA